MVAVVVIVICDCPLEVWVCPPPDVGSALHVPKSMVNVPEPTVAVVAEYVGPVKVCALARVDTVNDEFIVAAASEPEAERVAIVVSDELSALSSIKKGKDSSMWKAIQSQIDLSADVTLSAGNTGVLLVMSKMIF